MISATNIYEYFVCPYKIYNRQNRDKSLMIPPTDFLKRIMKLGREHEKEVMLDIKYERPKFIPGDFNKGYLETIKLMQKGANFIYQGVLKDENYVGIPDLLIKKKGKSIFGDYYYIPADIKVSGSSKEEQVMQLMLYNMLLEKLQKFAVGKGILILKKSSEIFSLENYKDKFESALAKIDLICKGLEYGLHIDGACKECPWKEVCIPIAKKTNDVSLIYGLSRSNHYKLIEKGIKTLNDLVKIDSEKIVELLETTDTTVEKWKIQANVLLSKKDKITKINLPKTKNHICFDIETSEDGRLYLIGLWHKKKFVKFFDENNEKKLIEDFAEYLFGLKDYVLYHYGSYERTMFKQLFDKHKINDEIRSELFSKMIDLFQMIKKNAVLPLVYYNLKDVAKHFGFKWRASDASGGNSMLWFDEWRRTKNKKLLKKILNYNEDDVKGNYVVLKKISNAK